MPMFADPQSVTVNAVPVSLPKIASTGQKSTYRSATGEWELVISHDEKNRHRKVMALTQKIVAEDPFLTGTNRSFTQTWTLVGNVPAVGFTATQMDYAAQALVDFAADATLDKLIAGES